MRRFLAALLLSATVAWAQETPAPEEAITVGQSGPGSHKNEPRHDKIWTAVVQATNVTTPKDAPLEIRDLVPRLKHIFGYNQFEILGSETEIIDELTENWLVPTPIFPLNLTARRAVSPEARGGYLLDMKMFQGKRHIIDSEVKLAPGSPLFIKGPLHGKGQIIIILQVQR